MSDLFPELQKLIKAHGELEAIHDINTSVIAGVLLKLEEYLKALDPEIDLDHYKASLERTSLYG